ncbi:amidohydrolase family protein [Variovorax rhizosphaerae]|uniref:Amidohydrolase family protein n=1 Tax=Variovorax rhizosphaerae TaxID=1836200 RepID=A0ABU8WU98_9BURK
MVQDTLLDRRQFCALGTAVLGLGGCAASADGVVPYSAGVDRPKTAAPAGATDCHMHFFDKRVATVPGAPVLHPDALAPDYRAYQRRIGTQRCVLVTPSAYGTNNQVMVEGMAAMGAAVSRGVAVLRADVSDAELRRLHTLGVRGVRFNLVQAGAVTIDQARLLSPRLADMGWHIQFHLLGERLPDAYELLGGLPSRIVFDHMGRIPLAEGTSSAGYQVLRRLIDKGNTWVKLSGPYLSSTQAPQYPNASALAKALAKAAPERMVWGSDWPHATEKTKPNDAVIFDLLADWAPEASVRRRILVDNPAKVYDFPAP